MTRRAASARSPPWWRPDWALGCGPVGVAAANRGEGDGSGSTRAQADGTDARTRLLAIIRKKSLLRGTFKLVSGATSDYYLDMKPTTFDPEGATSDRRDHLRHAGG